MTYVKRFCSVMVLLSACWVLQGQAASYAPPVQMEGQGVIHGLSFETDQILVGGQMYYMSQTARVEIAGSYGAFTMLKEGMKVRFNYLEYADGRNEIVELYEDNNIEDS
ncbi:MAG: hypothetical protein AAF993_04815 [Pseudomonadota bacterium]